MNINIEEYEKYVAAHYDVLRSEYIDYLCELWYARFVAEETDDWRNEFTKQMFLDR